MATAGTVGNMIEIAKRRVDQLVIQASGKWSEEWWLGLANEVRSYVASITGFYNPRQAVAINNHTQTSALPTNIIGPIKSIYIGTQEIKQMTERAMRSIYPEWRYQADWPNQPSGGLLSVVSTSAEDAQEITLYGWDADGVWQSETTTIAGTTPASFNKTFYEVACALLSDPAVGTVTLSCSAGTIAAIAPGLSSAGHLPVVGVPRYAVIAPPNIEWYPVPNADYTAIIRAPAMPAVLESTADTIQGLPVNYDWVIAEGMAALASGCDLYTNQQQGRAEFDLRRFMDGITQIRTWAQSLSMESNDVVGRMGWSTSDSWESTITLPIEG